MNWQSRSTSQDGQHTNLEPQLGGLDGGNIATRSTSNNHDILLT